MFDFLYEHVYIIGEVDERVIRLDFPWFRNANMCLRYSEILKERPKDDVINIRCEKNVAFLYLFVPPSVLWSYPHRSEHGSSNVILLGGYRNKITGVISSIYLIRTDIVPQINGYAKK